MQQIVVEMQMMGRIGISVNGSEVIWKTKRIGKLWCLLCLLAARGEDWVSSREMALLLWGAKDANKTRNDVKSAISHLRKELAAGTSVSSDDVIEYGNGGYRLGPAVKLHADFVELREIGKKLEGRGGSVERRLNQYRRLVDLYKGSFYCDEDCPPWMEAHAEVLRAEYLAHMGRCCEVLCDAERYEDVLELHRHMAESGTCCDQVTLHSYRAMQALGRHDEILKAYNTDRRELEKRSSPILSEIRRIAQASRRDKEVNTRVLDKVRDDLAPKHQRSARVLDYPQLQEVCRQNPGRYAMTIFTFQPAPGAGQDDEALQQAMNTLVMVATDSLRGHDIITPYSDNQLLIVMPNHSLDSSHLVRDRLQSRLVERLDLERVSVNADVGSL